MNLEDSEVLLVASEMLWRAMNVIDHRPDIPCSAATMSKLMEMRSLLKVYSMSISRPAALLADNANEGEEHPF